MQSIYRDGTSIRIVRSDGAELTAGGGYGGGWTVSWEGLRDFNSLPISLSTSANVLTDGSTLVSKRVDECERTASIFYKGPRDPASVRDECLSFFNPKHSFAVHVTHMGRTRWCEGELADVKCEILADRFPCQCTFTVLCPDPYMRGEDIHDETMTDARPMFTFPFRCFAPGPGVSAGCVASFRVYDGLNTVINSGGIPAPFRIRAEFGDAITNPRFTVNDKFVEMEYQFKAGDVLVIDFMASPPQVTLNGESSIHRCTRDSVFVGMALDVGRNQFSYTAERGDTNTMDVSIVYYDRFMGV